MVVLFSMKRKRSTKTSSLLFDAVINSSIYDIYDAKRPQQSLRLGRGLEFFTMAERAWGDKS